MPSLSRIARPLIDTLSRGADAEDACRPSAALESWAVAGKLGILRALIRDKDEPQDGVSDQTTAGPAPTTYPSLNISEIPACVNVWPY